MKKILFILLLMPIFSQAQFAPPAGQPGSTAIYKDSAVFVNWATNCTEVRGWQNIADTSLGKANVGDSSMACGPAGTNGVVSLGDRGSAILTFAYPIINGPSWDFAVFENSFSDTFLELAFVEVSSDGINYFRFPSTSLTQDTLQIDNFGAIDATKINNLAGKYILNYGTPFDLQELSGISGLDINHITHVKIIDVVGSIEEKYASFDAFGHIINDPWTTAFPSSGFDLDAVGVIHQDMSSVQENDAEVLVNVFPNPCKNVINIKSVKNFPFKRITLIDINGKLLNEIVPVNDNTFINMEDFKPGVYILKTLSGNSVSYHKILKN